MTRDHYSSNRMTGTTIYCACRAYSVYRSTTPRSVLRPNQLRPHQSLGPSSCVVSFISSGYLGRVRSISSTISFPSRLFGRPSITHQRKTDTPIRPPLQPNKSHNAGISAVFLNTWLWLPRRASLTSDLSNLVTLMTFTSFSLFCMRSMSGSARTRKSRPP